MTKTIIRKIFRIVLLLADGAQRNWEEKDWTCLKQGDIGSFKADELKSKTDEFETGKYKKYLFRGQPLLMEREAWRFVDVQGDTLGDIYVIVCPRKNSDKKWTFVLEQHKFSGGIDFTYTDAGNTLRFFWIPSYIPKFFKDSFDFSEPIEEKTYIVFNHVKDICSKVRLMSYECGSEQLEKLVTPYSKDDPKYSLPTIFSLSDNNDIFCTGGSTQFCKKLFVKNRRPPLRIEGFLKFYNEAHISKAPTNTVSNH